MSINKITAEVVNERIQKGWSKFPARPYIRLVPETYISTKIKATFVDEEYGEWNEKPGHVMCGCGHPERKKSLQKTQMIDEVQRRIIEGYKNVPPRTHIRLVRESYRNYSRSATFIDEEFGEFHNTVANVVDGAEHSFRHRVTAQDINQRIVSGWGKVAPRQHLQLKEDTYQGLDSPATFIDEEFGDWQAAPSSILQGAHHPMRNKVRKRTPQEVEALIKETRPWLSMDYASYVNGNTKCRWVDEKFGEWWAVPSQILARSNTNHPSRYIEKLTLDPLEVNRRLTSGHGWVPPRPHLSVRPETYQGYDDHAVFVDSEFGEFVAYPNNIFKGVGHPQRRCSRLELRITTMTGLTKYNRIPPFLKGESSIKPDFQLTEDVFLECDGLYHHGEKKKGNRHHYDRRELFESFGKTLLQFRQDEIEQKPEIVRSMILRQSGKIERKVYARPCVVTQKVPRSFWLDNHLMGYASGIPVGLEKDGEVLTAISYQVIKRELHIIRFCSKLNTQVVGGFSKLLSHVLKETAGRIDRVVNFVDLRYGTGKYLLQLDFKLVSKSLGWKWTDGANTYNRRKCRANMDERRLTEKEHASELGWYKIYDAGQAKYVRTMAPV